jgi:acetyl esterase/lipase
MKTQLPLMLSVLLIAGVSYAEPSATPTPIPLWSVPAPYALGNEDKDIPTITPYLVDSPGTASAGMLVCPGGGYHTLTTFEGDHYARWLNELGISGFVLKYRLSPGGYRHPAMITDATRALRTIRSKAAVWNVDPNRIGVMGSSAGGHLASTLMTHFDAGDAGSTDSIERVSSRPDLGILCYPVISFGAKGHRGSQENLLGPNPSTDLIKDLSNELKVTRETPPTFLLHTAEDSVVRVENSLLFADALARHDVPFALHIYPKGIHGVALGSHDWNPEKRHPWTTQCALWLREQGFTSRGNGEK